jgi:hypothetical protein
LHEERFHSRKRGQESGHILRNRFAGLQQEISEKFRANTPPGKAFRPLKEGTEWGVYAPENCENLRSCTDAHGSAALAGLCRNRSGSAAAPRRRPFFPSRPFRVAHVLLLYRCPSSSRYLRPGRTALAGVRCGSGILKNAHKFSMAPEDLGDRSIATDPPGTHLYQGIPEGRPAYSKADRTVDSHCSSQPLPHFLPAFSSPENDAANPRSRAAPPATATIFLQSSRRSSPSTFQLSGPTLFLPCAPKKSLHQTPNRPISGKLAPKGQCGNAHPSGENHSAWVGNHPRRSRSLSKGQSPNPSSSGRGATAVGV